MSELLWQPTQEQIKQTQMFKFLKFVAQKYDVDIKSYRELHRWSVDNIGDFWSELFDFFSLKYSGELVPSVNGENFQEYSWFSNVKLNFAENLLKNGKNEDTAINFIHESGIKQKISYREVRDKTFSAKEMLKHNISKGDVVAAFMPNIPETIYGMLGCSSLGGVFTSTSCDFGVDGVIDRFGQARPKVLFTVAGYEYNGKYYDLITKIKEISKQIPSIEKIIIVDFLDKSPDITQVEKAVLWKDINSSSRLDFEPMPFNSPLYIMYSSGTTGKPKCIVHSIGGTLLQHVKELGLHSNLGKGKNIFYFTTCGWMMWNWLVSGLLFGGKITLYEGAPGVPTIDSLLSLVDEFDINYFGTSPKFLKALEDSGYNKKYTLSSLETILCTGAPLNPEQFDFVYSKIKGNVQLSSICGGTDIIGCFMLGNPMSAVRRGEIQCLGLGMDVACFDEFGNKTIEVEGELVCLKTFPSRPIYFLNDSENVLIKKAYFNKYENIWHHGDYIKITEVDSVIVFGRSDATLNPGGVRIGTAEIYRQTEQLDFIEDSICVGKKIAGEVEVQLFVILKNNLVLDDEKKTKIKTMIRTNTTPRHMPKNIFQVQGIPYTRSGKKMELCITKIINNQKLGSTEAVSNIDCLDEYEQFK